MIEIIPAYNLTNKRVQGDIEHMSVFKLVDQRIEAYEVIFWGSYPESTLELWAQLTVNWTGKKRTDRLSERKSLDFWNAVQSSDLIDIATW